MGGVETNDGTVQSTGKRKKTGDNPAIGVRAFETLQGGIGVEGMKFEVVRCLKYSILKKLRTV